MQVRLFYKWQPSVQKVCSVVIAACSALLIVLGRFDALTWLALPILLVLLLDTKSAGESEPRYGAILGIVIAEGLLFLITAAGLLFFPKIVYSYSALDHFTALFGILFILFFYIVMLVACAVAMMCGKNGAFGTSQPAAPPVPIETPPEPPTPAAPTALSNPETEDTPTENFVSPAELSEPTTAETKPDPQQAQNEDRTIYFDDAADEATIFDESEDDSRIDFVLERKSDPAIRGTVDANKPSLIVGRDNDGCDIVIDDPRASRKHFEIFLDLNNECLRIRDLGSSNGTRLNGALITEVTQLSDEDVIRIGQTEFTFQSKK